MFCLHDEPPRPAVSRGPTRRVSTRSLIAPLQLEHSSGTYKFERPFPCCIDVQFYGSGNSLGVLEVHRAIDKFQGPGGAVRSGYPASPLRSEITHSRIRPVFVNRHLDGDDVATAFASPFAHERLEIGELFLS